MQGPGATVIIARCARRLAAPPDAPQEPRLESNALARLIFDAMADKQAEDLIILDLRPVSVIADFFVIGSAANERQLKAIIEAVAEASRLQAGEKPIHVEGDGASGWVLMDYGDVVAHVFDPERRRFYALEAMWDEAPLVARMA